MTNLEHTPFHEETGLALPIRVTPEDFVVKRRRQHHKEHPEKRPELRDYTGKALRRSSTQELPNHMHMGKHKGSYHDIFWGTASLPQTHRQKINRAIANLAIIPRKAIALTGDGYELVELDNDEYDFICHPGITHIEGNTPRKRHFVQQDIGGAVLRYAVADQDVTGLVYRRERDTLLSTVDSGREREVCNLIIRRAIEEALRPAFQMYEEAKKEGMVNTRKLSLRAIVRNFIPEEDFSNYYSLLYKKLKTEEPPRWTSLQTEVDAVELAL